MDNDEEDPDVTYAIVNDSCRTKGQKIESFWWMVMFSRMTQRLASIRWWIIINKDQQYKVIDLTLAGVSLTLQKKTSLRPIFQIKSYPNSLIIYQKNLINFISKSDIISA